MKTETAKHTSGPWEAWNAHGGKILNSWRVGERNTTPGVVLPVAVVSNDRSGDEQIANAQLIAAAPELLAACKVVEPQGMAEFNAPDDPVVVIQLTRDELASIRSAIAKAEGR